jgi:hypothetical protein
MLEHYSHQRLKAKGQILAEEVRRKKTKNLGAREKRKKGMA